MAYKEQTVVLNRLSKAFENNRVGHAYLFEGENGTGKEALAIYFSQLILCAHPKTSIPCGQCHNCRLVKSKNHPNITIIRPKTERILVDQIKDLLKTLSKKSFAGGRKIYIIAQAERMGNEAANALLKYLEEPDGEVTAILLTSAYNKILPTIQSRCQRISFLPPSREQNMSVLVERGITPSMAATVTLLTENIDEAYELAQDDVFAQMRKTVLKLVEAFDENIQEALLFIQSNWSQVFRERVEVDRGLDLLLYVYRDVVAIKSELTSTSAYPDQGEFLNSLAMKMTYAQLSAVIDSILLAKKQLYENMNRQLLMEQLMLNMQEGFLIV